MLAIAAFVLPASQSRCSAQTPISTPARQTEDLSNDLIDLLLQLGRVDEALQICRTEIRQTEHQPLEQAKWTARLAESLAEKNAGTVFGVKSSLIPDRLRSAVRNTSQPIESYLATNPDTSAALFLKASQLKIRHAILKSAIVAASVSVMDDALSDSLLKQISRLQSDAESLGSEASAMWSRMSQNVTTTDSSTFRSDQYERLVRELALNRIQLAILTTELFPKDGDDYRSAAASAIALAEDAILALPDESDAKGVAQRLLAEASLRSGDLFAARRQIRSISDRSASETPGWVSLQVRLLIAEGKTDQANSLCQTFYESATHRENPLASLPVDFAKLELLIDAEESDAEITAWLETIQKRGGLFARRRAEAMAIKSLRLQPSDSPSTNNRRINPSLIAVQGEDALRRGEPGQAANLLREAAIAERDPKLAFSYARKSAASAIAGKDTLSAINTLRSVARKHVAAEDAVELMMQAALLGSKPFLPTDDPKLRLNKLIGILQEVCQTWPASDQSVAANAWHCKILVAMKRNDDAARSSLELLTLGGHREQVDAVSQQWFGFVKDLELAQAGLQLSTLDQSFQELIRDFPMLAPAVMQAAALLLDPNALQNLAASSSVGDQLESPVAAVLEFRLQPGDPQSSETLLSLKQNDPLVQRIRWRLERDASLSTTNQQAIGKLLQTLAGADPWQVSKATFWANQDNNSITLLKRLATSSGRPEKVRSAIHILSHSDSKKAKRTAVELADFAASKLKLGDPEWYQVKWQAASLTSKIGDVEEAKKRARYVLLLHPPEDAEMKQRFKQLAQ